MSLLDVINFMEIEEMKRKQNLILGKLQKKRAKLHHKKKDAYRIVKKRKVRYMSNFDRFMGRF